MVKSIYSMFVYTLSYEYEWNDKFNCT